MSRPLKITFPPCDFYEVLDNVGRGIYELRIPHVYAEIKNKGERSHKIDTEYVKGHVVNIWTKSVITCESMVCEWCRRKFKDRMVGVPISVDGEIIKNNYNEKSIIDQLLNNRHVLSLNISLIGCLCSWECALSACRRNPGNYNVKCPKKSEQIIKLLYEDELRRAGKKLQELLPMPSPSIMQAYGGPLTTKEYMNCRGSRTLYEESSKINHVTWSWNKST